MDGEQTLTVADTTEGRQFMKGELREDSTQPETRVSTDCFKEDNSEHGKEAPITNDVDANEAKNGTNKPPITEYEWVYFKMGKEAFYMKEFLCLHTSERLDKAVLGIDDDAPEKRKSSPDSKEEEAPQVGTQFLGKRTIPDLDSGFGGRGFAKVINAIEERIHKFGKLGEDEECIKRKQHNNDEFYEQDEFIDDPIDLMAPQTMEIPISRYEDFFLVKGNIEAFKKHKKFNERIAEVKLRNRESKTKKNEESRKKREALQIQSLMKGDKKVSPEEHQEKIPKKAKSIPGTVLTKAKSKKAAAKKQPESAKPKVSSPIISKPG